MPRQKDWWKNPMYKMTGKDWTPEAGLAHGRLHPLTTGNQLGRGRRRGGCGCRKGGRKMKLRNWAKRGRQRGGFVFSLAAIGAAIAAGLKVAAPLVAKGAITAAAGYATTKTLEGVGGKTGRGRGRRRRIRRR